MASGALIEFNHNSDESTLNNCLIRNNEGTVLSMKPIDVVNLSNQQHFNVLNSNFTDNNGGLEGIFRVSQNSKLTVYNSSFNDNLSFGKGSVVSAT